MRPHVALERMGKGHALTISITWSLEPGEVQKLLADPEYRTNFTHFVGRGSQSLINKHLAQQLERLKP